MIVGLPDIFKEKCRTDNRKPKILMQLREGVHMQRSSRVSEAVITRLPKYYRYLKDMEKSGIQKDFIQGTEQRGMGLTAS